PKSVADVGCGSGAWLQVFKEHGVQDVLGVDGPYVQRASLRIPEDRFVRHDLSQPFRLDREFDLVISLEVAHYVTEDDAPGLVESIATLGPAVLFGAAVPHQPGGPGRNQQWPSWWAALFARHGLQPEDWLRPLVWEDERVDWWYAQNTVLYQRERAGERLRPLVHPGLLEEVARAPEPPEPPEKPPPRRRLFGRGRLTESRR